MKNLIDWAKTIVIITVLIPLVCIVALGIFDIAFILLASSMLLGLRIALMVIVVLIILLAILVAYVFIKSLGSNDKQNRTEGT